jgi:hypothetical protein
VEWVTAEEIIAGAGVGSSPSPADTEWAEASAAAVNAGYDHALEGTAVTGLEPELRWSARVAGIETYKRKEATFGLTGYVDLQGAAIRIARDYLEAQRPIIGRYATFGLG